MNCKTCKVGGVRMTNKGCIMSCPTCFATWKFDELPRMEDPVLSCPTCGCSEKPRTFAYDGGSAVCSNCSALFHVSPDGKETHSTSYGDGPFSCRRCGTCKQSARRVGSQTSHQPPLDPPWFSKI